MAEGNGESVPASTQVTDETISKSTTTTSIPAGKNENATEFSSPKEAEEEIPSSGEKRKADDGATADASTAKAADTATTTRTATSAENKPKKARIAMPPAVTSSQMDTDKYKLESPPPENNTNEADVTKKITTANLMLFGLHPLIKEGPLHKMLEDYGTVQAITVRSAFASRYCHVSFETVEEARECYVALHGAKLLHKTFLVQPSMASAEAPKVTPAAATKTTDSAGAAAAAAAVTSSASG